MPKWVKLRLWVITELRWGILEAYPSSYLALDFH